MAIVSPPRVTVFDRILCGIDGSAEALEAARQAERVRAPLGRIELATVVEVNLAVHAGWAMSRVLEELDSTARAALHDAVDEVHPARTHLHAGYTVPRLLEAADGAGATLLALGPRGHSRAVGMALGGASTELLHRAPCSVLFARAPRFGQFPSSVLAGADGSPESLAAVEVARSVAARFGSELVVVAAEGGKGVHWEALERYVPVVADARHPVEALTDLSREADLVVVGSRGLHGPRALGSVSERVAHRAASSVLVVRNP